MSTSPQVETRNPAERLLEMIRGHWISQAIAVAAELGLADCLAHRSMSVAELAPQVNLPSDSLHRLLRALCSIDVLAEANGRFSLTDTGSYLRSDLPDSLRATGIMVGRVYYPAWQGLLSSLQSGTSSFSDLFGNSFFNHLSSHHELGTWFQMGMSTLNNATSEAVANQYDFADARTIVDVGGGNGSLLAAILKENKGLHGILFDLPAMIGQADAYLSQADLGSRYTVAAGSFFDGVPFGADVYLLRWILHDFSDDDAVRILESCRAAISPGGRLLIIEQVVEPDGERMNWKHAYFDLHMLLLLGGRERTEADFATILHDAGFRLNRAIATETALSILEASPV